MRQAESVAKRLSLYGVDKIYSSTSNRAIQTAKPTSELTKNDIELVDFANESYAWNDLTIKRNGSKRWLFEDDETRLLFADESMTTLGNKWYEHPLMSNFKNGMDRIYKDTYDFFKLLGYEHIRNSAKYRIVNQNNERVALFAHQGFGLAFLSVVLNIPYPMIANHFDICHTGITAIEFQEIDGFAIPRVLILSSDSHIYREGLPTKYNNTIFF